MIEVRFVVDEPGGIRSVYERRWLDDPDEGDVSDSEGIDPLCCVVASLLRTVMHDWPGETCERVTGKLLGQLASESGWSNADMRDQAIALAMILTDSLRGSKEQ